MTIRPYKQEDEEKIQKLAAKHNILIPDYGQIYVAEDSEGNIVGFINLRTVFMIEPFVCENSLAAGKLFDEAILHLKSKRAPIVRAYIKNKHNNLSVKNGFVEVFSDFHIIEKIIEPLNDGDMKKLKERILLKNTNIN